MGPPLLDGQTACRRRSVRRSYPWLESRSIAYTRRVGRLSILLIAAAILAPRPAWAQIEVGQGGISDYEQRYGPPVEVNLDDLVQESSSYMDRSVRTKGRLDFGTSVAGA